ncbi:MAG: hypothetical protein R2865_16650 [Deinococcales bacterium]
MLVLAAVILTAPRFLKRKATFSSVATNIIAANPDVVFFPNQISSQAGGLITELSAKAIKVSISCPMVASA